jgi:hypothetical protein
VKDPFVGIVSEEPPEAGALRTRLLADAQRGYGSLRKVFVQRPDTEPARGSVLAEMVRSRQERALDAFLLVHALEPVLGSPLPLATWAKILTSTRRPCTVAAASRALDILVDRKLITRENKGRMVLVRPLLEDGSGTPWSRSGSDPATIGKGYLTVPNDYWTAGLVDRLELPGKAMLLIMLSETTKNPTFSMAVERAPRWYGISERTAERGYQQLRKVRLGEDTLLLEHKQVVVDPRSPTGLRAVWHRALVDPYSQYSRAKARALARRMVQRKQQASAFGDLLKQATASSPRTKKPDPVKATAVGHSRKTSAVTTAKA